MRLAILTDLHANREAVEAVLDHAEAQAADRYALLGDFVGYGADPAWMVELAREHVRQGAIVVQGNHDIAVVQGAAPSMRQEARHVIEWTRAQLDSRQIDFLASLPLTASLGALFFAHANAWDPPGWEYIHDRDDAVRSMLSVPQNITFCGHVHEPRLYHLAPTGKAGDLVPGPGVSIALPDSRRWLLIPGSAGQPRDGDPAACYALYDSDERTVTYWRVRYDTEAAAAKIRAAQLPDRLASRLADGQ